MKKSWSRRLRIKTNNSGTNTGFSVNLESPSRYCMYGFSWIAWMVFSSLKFSTCFTIPPINQTSSLCYVTISPVSDFLIDEKYNFVGNGKQSFRHVPTMYPPRIVLPSSIYRPCIVSVLFPYCFRFWKRERYENDRRTIRDRYGIDTGSIRD